MLRLFLMALLVAVAMGRSTNGSDTILGGRIIGGQIAPAGSFPYQAALFVSHGGSNSGSLCGGGIINRRWILTAAHCTYGYTYSEVLVIIGTLLWRSAEGIRHSASRVVNHPNYDNKLIINDIAVIQTETAMELSPEIRAIALGRSFVAGGVSAVISGWGVTDFATGSSLDTLKYLNTKTILNSVCAQKWGSSIRDTNICTFINTAEGTCQGDSGGPLVYDGRIIGVVSYGVKGCVGRPSVYTRVSSFHQWITAVTGIIVP